MRAGLVLSLILLNTLVWAQNFELTSINLTVQNGLAGDNVYCALQDDKGYIWFGTETGVSRYNGRSFENFYMSDGLADNEIFRIDQDSQGRIWFSAFNGQMSYYHQGQFFNKSNSSLVAAIKFKDYYINLFEDSKGNLWLTTKTGLAMIRKDGTVKNTKDFDKNGLQRMSAFMEKEGVVWAGLDANRRGYRFSVRKDTQSATPMVLGEDFSAFIDSNPIYLTSTNQRQASSYLNAFLDEENKVFHAISKIHNYPDEELWACTFRGATKIDKAKKSSTIFLEGKQVSHVLRDREGGYWFTTLGDGVFFVPSLEKGAVTNVNDQPIGNVTALYMEGDVLWFGGNNAVIGRTGEQGNKRWNMSSKYGRSRVKRIVPIKNSEDLLFVAEEAMILKKGHENFSRLAGSVKTVQPWADSLLVVGTTHMIYVLDLEATLKKFKAEHIQDDNAAAPNFRQLSKMLQIEGKGAVIDMEEYQGGVLVSTALGLYFLDNRLNFSKLSAPPIMNAVINDIKALNDSSYLLATSGYGTFLFKDGQSIAFSTETGMSSDINRKVFAQNDSTFWIATNAGINRVTYQENDWHISSIKSTDGLLSEDVNDLIIHGDYLIAATSKGISRINIPDWQSPKTPPLVSMNALLVDDSPWSDQSREIEHGVKNITVNFDGLHFQSLDRISYKYRLLGFDDTWRLTSQNSLSFGNLKSGEYTFQVKAISAFGDESKPDERSFVIATPFWMTWWFMSMAALVILLTLAGVINMILRRNRLKQERKFEFQLRIAEAERKALQSQLNPHFIFNSLNSIQNMVLDEDPESAYQYLAKFGKLIRRVLEFSDISMVPLTDELETLRLYMDLENLRLNDKFDYHIHIDEGVNLLEAIPSMIIQPHVENAIWHGIMPLKGKRRGRIDIAIRKSHEGLHFEVLDNGVGRKPNLQSEQRSMGTKIVNELIRKHKGEGSGEVEVEDLFDGNQASGTRIKIQILSEHIAYD